MKIKFRCFDDTSQLKIHGSDVLAAYASIAAFLITNVNGLAENADNFFDAFAKIVMMNDKSEAVKVLMETKDVDQKYLKTCAFEIEAVVNKKTQDIDIKYIPVENADYPTNLELLLCAYSIIHLVTSKSDISVEDMLDITYQAYQKLLLEYRAKYQDIFHDILGQPLY